MGTGKPRGAGRQLRFEARCNWCESVQVERDRLHVFLSPSGASLFELVCPECERVNFGPLSIADLRALALARVGTGWEEPRLGGPSGSLALERDAA